MTSTPPTPSSSTPFAEWSPIQTRGAADALAERITAHRREIHRHPELALEEHRTAAYVESVLNDLGVENRRVVGTGVHAVIRGEGPRTVGVRADMDALPIHEDGGRDGYRSVVDGVSHACGHDGHTAVALGLAELLARTPDLPGNVAFYFQPAEELHGGADPMVRAGVLDDPVPDAVLALHVAPQRQVGTIGIRSGPVVGSFDTVTLVVKGVGGHAAHPYAAIDPVPVAASIISATQQLMTREVDPMHPAVVTYGSIHGGTRPNVIPDEVTLEASVRALLPETRHALLDRLVEMARGIASAHRATLEADIVTGYPAGANDPELTATVVDAGAALLGADGVVVEPYPSLGSEDFFAFGQQGAPVCMFRLGVGNADKGISAPIHSPKFDLDEAALPLGVAVMAESIRRVLVGIPRG